MAERPDGFRWTVWLTGGVVAVLTVLFGIIWVLLKWL
jgi:hypothetical protein